MVNYAALPLNSYKGNNIKITFEELQLTSVKFVLKTKQTQKFVEVHYLPTSFEAL